jgi:hypothetical protein
LLPINPQPQLKKTSPKIEFYNHINNVKYIWYITSDVLKNMRVKGEEKIMNYKFQERMEMIHS